MAISAEGSTGWFRERFLRGGAALVAVASLLGGAACSTETTNLTPIGTAVSDYGREVLAGQTAVPGYVEVDLLIVGSDASLREKDMTAKLRTLTTGDALYVADRARRAEINCGIAFATTGKIPQEAATAYKAASTLQRLSRLAAGSSVSPNSTPAELPLDDEVAKGYEAAADACQQLLIDTVRADVPKGIDGKNIQLPVLAGMASLARQALQQFAARTTGGNTSR